MVSELLERLRNRIDVFARVETQTEFGEITFDYSKISTIWAEIVSTTGKENTIKGDSIQVSVTHKITVRNRAIKEPRNDMYFMFKGQKYEILYFMPHYRKNDLIEFYCKLILETEEDYNVREESYNWTVNKKETWKGR